MPGLELQSICLYILASYRKYDIKSPEDRAPIIKYLTPASEDFISYFLYAAKIYRQILCNSKPRYIEIIFLEEISIKIPAKDIKIKKKNSGLIISKSFK